MKSALVKSFIATDFIVRDGARNITIRVGQRSFAVDRLLSRARASNCAFITAFNPRSSTTSPGRNVERDRDLQRSLRCARIPFLQAYGDGERAVLAFNISRAQAITIGRRYRQDAIVYITRDRPAELLCLRWLGGK